MKKITNEPIYKIYYIQDIITEEVYIGMTKNSLKERINGHKWNKDSCRSKKIIHNESAVWDVIVDNLYYHDAEKLEKHYIQTTPNCINYLTYTFSQKEYDKNKYKNNKEQMKIKSQTYYKNNRDKVLLSKKQYYLNNKDSINLKSRLKRQSKKGFA
jgi:hypothetical protein